MVGAIGTVGNGQTQSSATSPVGSSTLDYNAFMKLLLAQMQNQDPLEPTASSDYVAQLATFSQVEQSMQTNDKLAELLASSLISQAGSLIGQQITSADGSVSGEVVSARVESGGLVAVLQNGGEVRIGPGVVIGGSAT